MGFFIGYKRGFLDGTMRNPKITKTPHSGFLSIRVFLWNLHKKPHMTVFSKTKFLVSCIIIYTHTHTICKWIILYIKFSLLQFKLMRLFFTFFKSVRGIRTLASDDIHFQSPMFYHYATKSFLNYIEKSYI